MLLLHHSRSVPSLPTMSSSIPQAFLCPISFELMRDPVVGSDGHTYERKHIETWLATHFKSPLTRQHMTVSDIKPNFALRTMIDEWLLSASSNNGGGAAAAPAPKSSVVEPPIIVHGQGCVSVEPKGNDPLPAIMILVLDSSGSMSEHADNKPSKEHAVNFTRRDLVKHSVRTVAAMLHERANTHLCLLHFSDATRTLLPTTAIGKSPLGLQAANTAIDALPTSGGTNLWDGIRSGLMEAKRCSELYPNANIQVMLLTDGEPTESYNPPGGIAAAVVSKMREMPKNVTLNCFGFGYALNTDLLDQICTTGRGLYGYIPDSSMVGTVFINFCAHVLSTVAIQLEPIPGLVIPHLQAGFPVLLSSPTSTPSPDLPAESIPLPDCLKAMEMVIHAAGTKEKDFRYIHTWIHTVLATGLQGRAEEFLRALQDDIYHEEESKGQLMKAVSTAAWYNTWGKNHLLSYRRALELQVCVNFKDAALQLFRGPLFKELQEMGTAKFIDLPAPTPTGYSAYGGAASNSAPINMSNFVAADGGCFSGSSLVKLASGARKRADACVKGDMLSNGSVIQCVVRTKLDKPVKMCILGDTLVITPWHPVVSPTETDRDAWQFPCYIVGVPKEVIIDAFYDFVVEGACQWAEIDGYKVAMLGHGMAYNDVIRHPYYGTQEVIRVLQTKSKEGWENGLIDL